MLYTPSTLFNCTIHHFEKLGNRKLQGKKKGPIMKDYFTVMELAQHFNVNPKTIYRRLWAKGIPAYKVGRSWRIAKKDIKWFRQ
jgi:excisionase family DNA binding protein